MNLIIRLARLGSLFHRHLLPLVVAAYVLAAVAPSPGLWARQCVVAEVGGAELSLPMLFLAALLFNASVGASVEELGAVVRRPVPIVAGVILNVLTPVAFLLLLRFGLRTWHDAQEVECLLLGLTVVAAMPVAGSSAAWSHTAGGNVALSLGLVVASTFLSPVTTPLVLAGVGGAAAGVSGHGAGGFLMAVVVVPSALGLLVRRLTGDRVATRLKPTLKAVNAIILLSLCYVNASVALPQVVADPDWDYLALVGASASGLCLTAFAAGWALAIGLRAGEADGRALVFGLGMSNNGTGLVMAVAALGSLPWAVVPVLAYNLVQHVVAAGVARTVDRRVAGGHAHSGLTPSLPSCNAS
jgi:BASS family bile acid:Na+ symporter